MYTSFFGLIEGPFNLTPDERYLFLSPYHKEALDHLLYGINERKGFIVITGGIGTGKTTLCRALLGHLDANTKSALVFNSFISDMELLRTVNQEFGIDMDPAAESKKDYIDALNNFLLNTFSSGGNAVLLIDEAQNLSYSVLEQIRMLSNLETEKEKLIQIVLVGQFELRELLASPSLRQLDERVMVRYDLGPLDRKNLKGYVEHRLVVGGNRGAIRFTKRAYREIYVYSRGNPRRINAVCDRGLLIAYAKGRHTISKRIILKAVKDLRGEITADSMGMVLPMKRVRSVALLLLLLFVLAGLAGWNFGRDIFGLSSNERKTPPVSPRYTSPMPSDPNKEAASLLLDERMSLAGLFSLFDLNRGGNGVDTGRGHLGLTSFNVKPEYYIMLKRPFRVLLSNPFPLSPDVRRYLLIRKTNSEGAIAVDTEGKDRIISEEFIKSHWGYKVSWLYPYKNRNIFLVAGMKIPDVLKIQKTLNEIGYVVEPTGLYDEATLSKVVRFQKDLGLIPDGVAGPRTRALLYLMSD